MNPIGFIARCARGCLVIEVHHAGAILVRREITEERALPRLARAEERRRATLGERLEQKRADVTDDQVC